MYEVIGTESIRQMTLSDLQRRDVMDPVFRRIFTIIRLVPFDQRRSNSGRGVFVTGQARVLSQRTGTPHHVSIFRYPYIHPHRLTLQIIFATLTHMGAGHASRGHPRHCILHKCVARFVSDS